MYKITNVNFTNTKYVCIHGRILNDDNSVDLSVDSRHFFMKIDTGYYLSTPRENIEQFDDYEAIEKEFEKNVAGSELEQLKDLKPSLSVMEA